MAVLSAGRVVETRKGMIVIKTQATNMTMEETWNVKPSDEFEALPGDLVEVNDDGTITIVNRPEPEKLIVAPTQLPPQE